MSSFMLWPAQASAHAAHVDLLIGSFGFVVWLLTLPVFVLMAFFAVRYRRGRAVNREHSQDRNMWLELSWSIIPFLIAVGFYIWSTALFFDLRRAPADAFTINVVAKQWMWKVQHPSGAKEIDALHVPADTPIKLVMTSEDVIHSMYLPSLRVKQDVLPGRTTTLWFEANRPGDYPLRCAEFCGTDHSAMIGRFVVLPPAAYARWTEANRDQGNTPTLAAQGRALFRRVGCSGCHGPASNVHAPPLANLYGSPVGLADGRTLIADEGYITDSIMLPNKDVTAGYAPIMPTYGNVLRPEQVNALVAYIKSGAEEAKP